jgi:hypothetical protein
MPSVTMGASPMGGYLPFHARQRRLYPNTGDLADPAGGDAALDSAYTLWVGSKSAGTGAPGRILSEIRKEHQTAFGHGLLVPWYNVEFHSQSQRTRAQLYVSAPEWWPREGWVSAHMFVPLPPLVTYRASRLLRGDRYAGRESQFWWTLFEAEWVTLVFSRWCTDIVQRNIMWRLPIRCGLNLSSHRVHTMSKT